MDQGCEESDRQQRQLSCGRCVFREADLAFLLINEERMFPLAELLGSLFNNTARTTLFTRMEKINTRRHFCNAQEIRMLKTVNGIHGSSAICTLIPEVDVVKYCEVFIDRTVDLKLFSTRRRKATRNDSGKTSKDSKQVKGGNDLTTEDTANDTTSTTTNVEHHNSANKRKKATTHKLKKGKTKLSRQSKNIHNSSNKSQLVDGCDIKSKVNQVPDSHTASTNHVLQGTQTNNVGNKPRKKRKAKEQECLSKDNRRQTKKAKISKATESNIYRKKHDILNSDADNSCLDGSSRNPCAGNTQQCSSSSLSQCLANASSEILFSDASSNDSGFASTTTSESIKASNPSALLEANRGKKSVQDNFATLSSSNKHNKNKKLKKGKEESKVHKESLSPPALVIKRQNNTWQVETKSTEKAETNSRCINTKTIPSKVKKRLKWPSSSGESHLHDKKDHNSNLTLKKKKKRKIAISDKDEAKSIQVDGGNVRSRKIKRAKVNQRSSNNVQVNIDDSTIKNSSLSKSTSSTKLGKSTNDQSKPVTTNSINNRLTTKKVAVRAKTLKANQNFKLMSLFSSFPMLSFKDGDLSPTYSEILPDKSEKPSPSHPIWKWQRGRPVYVPSESKKSSRIR